MELVGVSMNPSAVEKWWGPDGIQLATAPYHHIGGKVFPGQDERGLELAVNLNGPDDL